MKKKTLVILTAGIIAGLLLPFVADLLLFGTVTPCNTVTVYSDGSSIQSCKVRG